VGGHFAFALEPVRDMSATAFPDKSLGDEAFLVRGLSDGTAWGLLAAAGTAALLLLGLLVAGLRRRRAMPEDARDVALPLAVWFVVYAAFFVFWEPFNVEFWIPQVTALWLLLALLWAPAKEGDARRGTGWMARAAGL